MSWQHHQSTTKRREAGLVERSPGARAPARAGPSTDAGKPTGNPWLPRRRGRDMPGTCLGTGPDKCPEADKLAGWQHRPEATAGLQPPPWQDDLYKHGSPESHALTETPLHRAAIARPPQQGNAAPQGSYF
jgi:hypothetical protein